MVSASEAVAPPPAQKDYEFEVCLSFASDDLERVTKVAVALRQIEVRSFDYVFGGAEIWGKKLRDELEDLYENRAAYCVVFHSAAYARKVWTRRELKSAQARAYRNNRDYILLARLDDTKIPRFLREAIYVDYADNTPEELAEKIRKRVRAPEQPGRAERDALRKARRFRRRLYSVLAVALVLFSLTWYVGRHYDSHTSMTVGGATGEFVNVHLANSGWQPSTVAGYRLRFDGLPIPITALAPIEADAKKDHVPAVGALDVRLQPKGRELIPDCVNGMYPTFDEIEKMLGGHRVKLEMQVQESDAPAGKWLRPEEFDAKRLDQFIRNWIPARLPARC
jgi:TIR domain-containing protein